MSEWVQMFDGVRRRVIVDGAALMLVQVEFAASGCAVPQHSHPHEQATFVVSGAMEFVVDGQARRVNAGESIYLPSHVLHAAKALAASVVVDSFSPPREDFRV